MTARIEYVKKSHFKFGINFLYLLLLAWMCKIIVFLKFAYAIYQNNCQTSTKKKQASAIHRTSPVIHYQSQWVWHVKASGLAVHKSVRSENG